MESKRLDGAVFILLTPARNGRVGRGLKNMFKAGKGAGALIVAAAALAIAGEPASAQLLGDLAPAQQKPRTTRKTAKPAPAPAEAAPAETAAAQPKGQPAAAAAKAAQPAAFALPPPPKNGCQNTGTFEAWLAGFKKEAAAQGIKPATIHAVLDPMTLDPDIIRRDRGQSFFQQTFVDFSTKLATRNRYENGLVQMKKHREWFQRAETQYGVPPPVIAAFWALESDFGSAPGMGKVSILRSLGTLAYDCRRGEMFRAELMAALKIIDRGDLTPEEMVGSWAGEIGQTQFLPSHYYNYALDFDGDGRRDLYKSVPDVIGSSALFVESLGWKRGEPWMQEVRVPASLPWQEADLSIQHSHAEWAKWGVTLADGRPLPANAPPASLMLLMGRHGPAFLVYPNFQVYLKWNQSLIYSSTAAYLATRMAGSPPMSPGNGQVPPLPSIEQMKEMQQLLQKRGFDVGTPDGKLGAGTRKAIRAMQVKFGQPADSWPTLELLEALRAKRS